MTGKHFQPEISNSQEHEILTNDQMAQADRKACENGIESFDLMCHAGRHVAHIARSFFDCHKVLVLTGPGNNGGDGFIAAQDLSANGYTVTLACLVDKEKLKGDAGRAAQLYEGKIYSFKELRDNQEAISGLKDTLVIDAVFGTGLTRALESPVTELFDQIKQSDAPVLAVDIPSGVDGDSGACDSHSLKAQRTVTFFRKKLGHVLMPGASVCGHIHVVQIGIPESVLNDTGFAAIENHPDLWVESLPQPVDNTHKYERGHAVIFGGDEMTGAACLAARSCTRVGAGLCTLLVNQGRGDVYRSILPPHIIVREDPDWDDPRISARLVGPGAASGAISMDKIVDKFMSSQCPLVIDADALISGKNYTSQMVLTPHEGEFKRVFGELKGSKVERMKAVIAKTPAVIVLKGADTLIAQAERPFVINTMKAPYLATAGTGDVLAGMITGLVAQGMDHFMAACASVYIHSKAGEELGQGLVASDLPKQLPAIFREVQAGT